MAEVFAEDAVHGQRHARRPQGRGAVLGPLAGGRDPGRGRRDHRFRPHGRSERSRAPGGRPGGRRGGPRGRTPGCAPWRCGSRCASRRGRSHAARRRWTRAASSSCWAGPTRRPGPTGDAITQVQVGCGDSRRRVLIANSDGLLAEDDQIRTRFNVVVRGQRRHRHADGVRVARPAPRASRSSSGSPSRSIARTAAARALAKLSARPAPSGEVPIVLAGGSGGILFHEACGHGLEADHIVKDASVYTGTGGAAGGQPARHPGRRRHRARGVGQLRASTTRAARPARNVLIENGVLTDYMWDWLRARKEGRKSVGQRPPPELPAPADGPDDQHLPARRRPRTRTRSWPRRPRASTWRSSAAAR